MKKLIFEDTTVIKKPFVEIDGVEYEVQDGEFEGGTDLNAQNFNQVQNNIEDYIDGKTAMGSIIVEDINFKNLFDKTKTTPNKYIGADGEILEQDSVSYSDYIKVEPNKTYFIGDRGVWTSIALYDNNKVFKSRVAINNGVYSVPNDIHYMICNIDSAKINEFEVHLHHDNNENYTEQEQIIGTWLGVKLYRKVINIGVLPNNASGVVYSGLTNEYVTNIYGLAKNSLGYCLPIPYVNNLNQSASVRINYNENTHSIDVITAYDMSEYSGWVVIEYTKKDTSTIEEVSEEIGG